MIFKEVILEKQLGEIFTTERDFLLISGVDYVSPVFKLNPNAANPGAQLFGFVDAGFDGNIKVEAIMTGTPDEKFHTAVVLDAVNGGAETGFTASFLTQMSLRCLGVRFVVTGHSTSGGVITVRPNN